MRPQPKWCLSEVRARLWLGGRSLLTERGRDFGGDAHYCVSSRASTCDEPPTRSLIVWSGLLEPAGREYVASVHERYDAVSTSVRTRALAAPARAGEASLEAQTVFSRNSRKAAACSTLSKSR